MTNLTAVSRLGQANSSGDETALFLKMFGGEVLTAFERKLKILNAVSHKYAKHGKSASFPATGLATAKHHVAGESLYTTGTYLDGIKANEIEVFVDRPLIGGPVAVDSWDEMVNHYDVRAPYAAQLAQAIGKVLDQRVLIAGILGARQTTATVTGLPLGSSNLVAAGTAKGTQNGNTGASQALLTDGSAILASLFQAAARLDTNEVPEEGRFVAMDPTQYSAIVQNAAVLNKDFNGGISNGEFAGNKVYTAAGFTILKTNSYPRLTTTTPTGANNVYAVTTTISGTTSNSAMLCFHSSAIGVVSWREMVMQADLDNVEYQADILLAKMSAGIKWLRPEALFEITTI